MSEQDVTTQPGPQTFEHREDSSTQFRWLSFELPDWHPQGAASEGPQKTYLRMGGPDVAEEESLINRGAGAASIDPEHFVEGDRKGVAPAGWMDFTDGSRTSITMGRKTEFIMGGDYRLQIAAGTDKTYDAQPLYNKVFYREGLLGEYRILEHAWIKSTSFAFGDQETFFGGFQHSTFVGLQTELNAAAKIEVGAMGTFSSVRGPDVSYTESHEVTAKKQIHMEVDPSESRLGTLKRFLQNCIPFVSFKKKDNMTGAEIDIREDSVVVGMAKRSPGTVTVNANGPNGEVTLSATMGKVKIDAREVEILGTLRVNGNTLSARRGF